MMYASSLTVSDAFRCRIDRQQSMRTAQPFETASLVWDSQPTQKRVRVWRVDQSIIPSVRPSGVVDKRPTRLRRHNQSSLMGRLKQADREKSNQFLWLDCRRQVRFAEYTGWGALLLLLDAVDHLETSPTATKRDPKVRRHLRQSVQRCNNRKKKLEKKGIVYAQ